MADHISRDAAIRELCGLCLADGDCMHTCKEITALQSIPAADVREVVLCQECVNCIKTDDYEWWCNGRGWPMVLTTKEGFCSYGRKN